MYTPVTQIAALSAGSFALWLRSALQPMLRHCFSGRAFPEDKISHLNFSGFRVTGVYFNHFLKTIGIFTAFLLLESTITLAQTPRIPALKSWGYQLQNIVPSQIAQSNFDLMVIDFSKDGSGRQIFSKAEVQKMKRKPDGSKRILLAYLSIGEAEDYRDYWRKRWHKSKPKWIGKENPNWKGNYIVKYWYPEWQDLIFGGANAYLDRIMAAGFDGVYLDRVDSYEEIPKSQRPNADQDMIKFVSDLAQYANQKRPFYIMAQNAEGLASDKAYLKNISAIGKEDLLYGINHDDKPNTPEQVAWSRKYLQMAQDAGVRVYVIEYLKQQQQKTAVKAQLNDMGMTVLFATRALDTLP